jgi:hypothetical protein
VVSQGTTESGSYGLGAAGLAAGGAYEVEDGLGGLGEVGVGGGLGVRLRLLHAPQQHAAVAALQRQPRHRCCWWCRDRDPVRSHQIWEVRDLLSREV